MQSPAARLFSLLQVRPAESNLVGLLAGLTFLTAAGGAVGSPGIEALFYSRFGVQFLPYMYIALGALTLVTSLLLTTAIGRFDRSRLYTALPLALAVLLILKRFVIDLDISWTYPLMWLSMNVIWVLQGFFVWGLAGLACDTRQAKRLFPLFGAGGILGLSLGGLLTQPLVGMIGAENLLLVWAAALVASFSLSRALVARRAAGERGRSRRMGQRRRQPGLLEGLLGGWRFVRSSELMRWMTGAAVLFAVLWFSLVFPFAKAVTVQFPAEADLAGFLGLFAGLSSAAAMAISLLAANRLYARLGFMATILAYPLLYLLGFTTLALAASFPVLVAFRFAQVAWSEGVSEGANQAMFNLVPPEQREQTRTFVRGVANQVGTSLAGGVLLIGELGMGSRAIFLIGSAAALATTYFVLRASRAYGGAVTEALRAGLPHLFFSEEQPFGGFRQDAAAVQAVIDGITSPEPSVRRVSAEILANLGLPQAAEAAVAALDDEDPAVRAALLRALARAGASGALLEVLPHLHDPAPEVRRQAVEAVRQLSGYPSGAARQIRPLLDDSDPMVRSRAALTLLCAGDNPVARRVLEMMARSDESPNRLAALEALAEWGDPSAFDLVAARLDDPNPAVRQRAVDAIGQIDAERCLMPLAAALGDEDDKVRQALARVLGKIGAPALEATLLALEDPERQDGALFALEQLPARREAERVRSYAHARAERAMRYYRFWRAMQPADGERLALLADSLHARAFKGAQRALQAISLLGDTQAMSLAIEVLEGGNPRQRANALETLETLGDRETVRFLLPLWEPEVETADLPGDSWIIRLLEDEDPWLRACTALAAAENPQPDVRARLEQLAEHDPEGLVRGIARSILNGGASMEDTLPTVSIMERILFLRRVPLFAGLPPADLEQIAEVAGELTFAEGDHLVVQGELGEEMYILVSGEVRVVVEDYDSGEPIELVRRGPGEYVGEMAVISEEPRMASLIAAEGVRALYIDKSQFRELLRRRPQTSLAVIEVLCERLRETVHHGDPAMAH